MALTAVVALPPIACADEEVNFAADAKNAEDMPPMISHRIADNATGETCLACHRTGLNGAPTTPHPTRLNCTQCHIRSDLNDVPPVKPRKQKKISGK